MHKQPRTSAQIEAVKRLQTTRRARRGLVAGYIHELSGRHADDNKRKRVALPAKTA